MDHSSLQHQKMEAESLETLVVSCPKPAPENRKPARESPEQALRCPRCDSTNTKFCYYNNYSLSQPRYFCKSCRRYWTKGGTLRNVPVGGGCRKNKRSSPATSSSSSKRPHDYPVVNPLSADSNPLISLSSGSSSLGIFDVQSFCYGFGGGSSGVENGGLGAFEGLCNGGDGELVLCGFPWQMNNNTDGSYYNVGNGMATTSWHGLLNSPLM